MKHQSILSIGVIGGLPFVAAATAEAITLTFDDISPITADAPIPDGYGGFTWDNFGYIHQTNHSQSGYINGRVSGEYVAFNYQGNMAVTSGAEFTFNSAYFTGAWRNNLNVTVTGFLGVDELFSKTFVVQATGPTFVSFDWEGVDTLRFESEGGTNAGFGPDGSHFVMDNFKFNDLAVIPTPSLALGGMVLFGALGLTRPRQHT